MVPTHPKASNNQHHMEIKNFSLFRQAKLTSSVPKKTAGRFTTAQVLNFSGHSSSSNLIYLRLQHSVLTGFHFIPHHKMRA